MADIAAFFAHWAEPLRVWLGTALALAGGVLVTIGAVGVLRFPDFYTRLHAASVTDTMGATLLLLGMALLAGWSLVTFKLALIWMFLFLTSPTASHAAANAAHTAGLEPIVGRWRGDDKSEDGA
ncbi:MAG: monovalent cation/H(+) antiporter subunit G [Pseudomonadota bacterium]